MKGIIFAVIAFVVFQNVMNIHGETNGNNMKDSKNCPSICPLILFQVCGYDPKANPQYYTFANNCTLNVTNCRNGTNYQIIYRGKCNETSPASSNCLKPCTREYSPVCACYQKNCTTYSNKCTFEVSTCPQSSSYTLKNGTCEESTPNCPEVCFDLYSPVCACNQTSCTTYSNECEFERENCKRTSLYSLKDGTCNETTPNCPQVCTAQYSPVCACNQTDCVTFSNNCNLGVANCQKNPSDQYVFKNNGTCEEEEDCNTFCYLIYAPVCACNKTDCETFGNDCFLNAENCGEDPENWFNYKYDGECKTSGRKND